MRQYGRQNNGRQELRINKGINKEKNRKERKREEEVKMKNKQAKKERKTFLTEANKLGAQL